MAVVVETTMGDITIDLYTRERPRACANFLKLCKIKYYNFNLFHTVSQGFIAQTGDPTGSRVGGESVWGVIDGPLKRYFEAEDSPRIKHTTVGLVSFVGDKDNMLGSQFFITLASDLTYLDAQHCVFGEVAEGFEVLRALNEAICDSDHRPYQDIRITHTVILEDPFPDPAGLKVPDRSPEPTAERLQGGRIAPDEEIDETAGKSAEEVAEIVAAQEAKARATILEMIGDIPDAEMAPPENVLFVCKLNPVTNDDDLEIIFSRFGKIKSCEVIRDKKTGDSLQYAFVEFAEQKACEDAYFKMDNVLIDDRRIHVDFSQSVAKVRWLGKGRGVAHFDDRGERQRADPSNDLGNGRYLSSDRPESRRHGRDHGSAARGRREPYGDASRRDRRSRDDRPRHRADARSEHYSRRRSDRTPESVRHKVHKRKKHASSSDSEQGRRSRKTHKKKSKKNTRRASSDSGSRSDTGSSSESETRSKKTKKKKRKKRHNSGTDSDHDVHSKRKSRR